MGHVLHHVRRHTPPHSTFRSFLPFHSHFRIASRITRHFSSQTSLYFDSVASTRFPGALRCLVRFGAGCTASCAPCPTSSPIIYGLARPKRTVFWLVRRDTSAQCLQPQRASRVGATRRAARRLDGDVMRCLWGGAVAGLVAAWHGGPPVLDAAATPLAEPLCMHVLNVHVSTC